MLALLHDLKRMLTDNIAKDKSKPLPPFGGEWGPLLPCGKRVETLATKGRVCGSALRVVGLALGHPSRRVCALPSRNVFRCMAAIRARSVACAVIAFRGFHSQAVRA